MSTPDAADAIGRSFAALAEVPRALASLLAEVAALRAEVASLRGALPPALVTLPEAAERLGLSLSTVRRRVADGSLLSRRIGRSIRVDLSALHSPNEAEVVRLADAARRW